MKVSSYKKLVLKSAVRFLFLFVLVDAILQKVVFLNKKWGIFFLFQKSFKYIMMVKQ
jgi:hypothetical protein